MKGRNENLLTALPIEEKAKKKALQHTLLIFIGAVILICLSCGNWDISQLIVVSLVAILLIILLYFLLVKAYKDEEVERINISLVEECLSTKSFTEVIPTEENDEFIFGLTDIAKFYAIISRKDSRWVNVYVKFFHEEEKRFLEELHKGYFLEYFSIREENNEKE